jgi:DNA repair protein RecO (recombination protein O)
VVAYQRADRDLNRLKEVKSAYVFRHLPFELVKGTVGLFMAELVQKTIRVCEPDQELFQFLFDSFVFLDQSPNSVANIHLVFLLKLSHYIGFGPTLSTDPERPIFNMMEGVYVGEGQSGTYTLNRKQSDQLAILLNTSFEDCHNLRFLRQERHDLLIQLLDYYRLHLEHFKGLNSHMILHEVLG